MLHYIKRDEKLQGCSRCLTEWSNKDLKSALGTQTAKGEGRDRSHNCNFPSVSKCTPCVAVPHTVPPGCPFCWVWMDAEHRHFWHSAVMPQPESGLC